MGACFSEIAQLDEFLALDIDQVIEIISSDHLTTAGEENVCLWKALIAACFSNMELKLIKYSFKKLQLLHFFQTWN